jgi:serine/threonine protein kinase
MTVLSAADFGTSRFMYNLEGQLLDTLGKIKVNTRITGPSSLSKATVPVAVPQRLPPQGTYSYTPPELYWGEIFTPRGDVWACAIVQPSAALL